MSEGRVAGRPVFDRRHLLLSALALAAGACLDGCVPSLPGQGPPPRNFRLTPKSTFPPDLPKVGWSLAIAEPVADRSLDTDRIALIRGGLQVDYIAGATWSDRAPTMIQDLMVESFQSSGAIMVVGTDRDRLSADFLLRSTLRAFNLLEREGEPTIVRVRLDTELFALPGRKAVGSQSFAADATPASDRLQEAVEAFDEATGEVFKQLVVWTLAAGQRGRRTGA